MKSSYIYYFSMIGGTSALNYYNKKKNANCYSESIPNQSNIIEESAKLIKQNMSISNCPGLTISVSVNGQNVWTSGFGLSDVENDLPCSTKTVMRIASISKSLTAVAVAELIEKGSLDIDLPVQTYVPSWPDKHFNGQSVVITTRQLLSMLGGIRHYDKTCPEMNPDKKKKSGDGDLKEFYMKKNFANVTKSLNIFKDDDLCCLPGSKYLYSTYSYTLVSAVIESVTKQKFSVVMTDLFRRMGMKSTYMDENKSIIYNRAKYYQMDSNGKLKNAPYVDNSNKWAGGGMLSTADDLCLFGTALLYSHQYNRIVNALKNKGATSQLDMDQFNAKKMPTNSINNNSTKSSNSNAYLSDSSIAIIPAQPFLKPETMRIMWAAAKNTKCAWDSVGGYAMGWCAVPQNFGKAYCGVTRGYFSHTGGAVGASSVLLILPRQDPRNTLMFNANVQIFDEIDGAVSGNELGGKLNRECEIRDAKLTLKNFHNEFTDSKALAPDLNFENGLPSGVVVAILTNMQGVGLNALALEIAQKFENF